MSAPLAERLVCVLLFEHPLHENMRFGQCRNGFCTKLYSTVRPVPTATTMVGEDGMPRAIDIATVRRKLGSIAKQKAPGFSGNGPDLYAAQPDSWVEWAVTLFNVIQHT